MQNENWKESLRNLAADELRNIRSFVDELIQESEAKATIPTRQTHLRNQEKDAQRNVLI